MEKQKTLSGHLACLGAYMIFGFNIIICKDIARSGLLSPLGLFCFRALGAALLFWAISLFMPHEKVDRKDYLKIFAASMLGLYLTQMTFLVAIAHITPLDCSIVNSLTPVYTMFIAALVLKEPITFKKAGGVLLSLCGVIFLILNSTGLGGGATETEPAGILLIILNGLCFALYLGIFKPLIRKYSVVTFMKWMFLFSLLASVPFGFREMTHLNWQAMDWTFIAEVLFVIIFSTFVAYFLIPIGQKILRPTLVSMYSYVQPIIATTVSIYIGMDVLTWQKIAAAAAVFGGVMIVNRSKAAKN